MSFLYKPYFYILTLSLMVSELSYCATPKKPSLKDDFYTFINYNWLENTQIPKDKNIYNVFKTLEDTNTERLGELFEELMQNQASMQNAETLNLIHLYKSFMDTKALEAQDIKPLAQKLKEIDAIKDKPTLLKTMADLAKIGVQVPFSLSVGQDMADTNTNILGIYQSGLGLPDQEYYLSQKPNFLSLQKKYIQHMHRMFSLAKFEHPEQQANAVFELEKKLAATHWSRVESRDYDKLYNKYKINSLNSLTPNIQWASYLKEFGAPSTHLDSILVYQPSALKAFDALLSSVPLESWKAYLRWHLLSGYSAYLSQAFVDEHFYFYGKQLGGLLENKPREKRAIDLVNSVLSDTVGQLYVQKYFSAQSKAQMDALVQNLRQAFKLSLENNTWMTPKTKEAALFKLSNMNTKIGYPKKWKSYEGLNFKKDTLVQNLMDAEKYEFNREIKKLGQPVDREEWRLAPQTVNAYYRPNMNEIVFPAAILQPPLFDANAESAQNYGAIGAIIGHEISHGFDDQGRKFDAQGNLKNWWSEEDLANFNSYTQRLVKQYNQYEPLKGHFINGELTLGENIADISGLSIAYRALKLSEQKENKKLIASKALSTSYTPSQLFFISWAKSWRTKIRDEELQKRLIIDPHSPGPYRANGVVKNIDAFYDAFNIKASDKMYLSPEQRVNLWSFGTTG